MSNQNISLLKTRLHRPLVSAAYIHRPRLIERLEHYQNRSVVLVSAPAGYGKSSLISSWLEDCKRPSVWVSLDEDDNDLHQFLNYFVAAVSQLFPSEMHQSQAMVTAPILPPMPVLMATMINDLEKIEQGFIVVLDDIHCIKSQRVHELLKLVLRELPRCLQLVMVGRRDPLLPIASLRAGGRLTELRMRDLRFTADEAKQYLSAELGLQLDASTITSLVEKTEGWVTGLHLSVLAMRGREEAGNKLLELEAGTRYTAEYLLEEVLDRMPASIREMLLQSAVLDRFCAPLCDAVIDPGRTTHDQAIDDQAIDEQVIDGEAFISWLNDNNMFIIALDSEGRWFRYHHLFAQLLNTQLKRSLDSEALAALYLRASCWCEQQALFEEAVSYALLADDAEAAAGIVERHRDEELDANRIYAVDRWLEMLPAEIKQSRPRLLLTQAIVLDSRYRLAEIPAVVESARILMETGPVDTLNHDGPEQNGLDQVELDYLQGYLSFWQGDGQGSQLYLERALQSAPENLSAYIQGQIKLFIGLAEHISGHSDSAIHRLNGWIDEQPLRSGMIWERLKFGLATLHLLNADLSSAHHDCLLLLEEASSNGQTFVKAWADYLLAVFAFHNNDFAVALVHFKQVVKNRYAANHRAAIDSMVGIAIASEFAGKPQDADQSMRMAHDFASWTQDSTNLEVVFSSEARLALIRGDHDQAMRWQRGYNLPAFVPGMILFTANPCIDECRVLAAGDKPGLEQAAVKLQQLRQQTELLHFQNHTIEIIILQAGVADRLGQREQALVFLQEAIDMTQAGEWLRPFVEPGSVMVDLLEQMLQSDSSANTKISEILAAFPQSPESTAEQSLRDPLTWREHEVLQLLAGRLQNKEISAQLHISPVTVKAHLRNIYQKLNVSSRREAVAKAGDLGLIS